MRTPLLVAAAAVLACVPDPSGQPAAAAGGDEAVDPTSPLLAPLDEAPAAWARAIAVLRDNELLLPKVDNGFVYYARVDEAGRTLRCRRAAAPGAPEEVLIDDEALRAALGDEDGADAPLPSLGGFDVAPDNQTLAFAAETGRDRYAVVVKDLHTGETSKPEPAADFSLAWDRSGEHLYFAGLDEQRRPRRVLSMRKGERPSVVHEAKADVLVAPIDDDVAIFVQEPRGLLGFRVAPWDAEGTPRPAPPTPTDAERGGALPTSTRTPTAVR